MRAIVHIGMPKTGSSSIQDFLHLNADALADQGFCYRRFDPADICQREYLSVVFQATGRNFDDPVQMVASKMRTPDDVTRRAADLDRWIATQITESNADVWVISNEFLSSVIMRLDGQAAVHEWLSARFSDVRYVIYLRSQDTWTVSMYSQRLRDGFDESFADYLAQTKPRNYAKLSRHWARTVGAKNFEVRLFDRAALKDGDLIADFSAVAGINPNGLARPPSINQSYTRRCARAVRALNAVVGRVAPRHSALSRAIRKTGRTLAEATLNTGPALTLTPEQRATLLAPVAKSNEAVRKRWFSDRPTLFDTTPTQHAQAGNLASSALR